MGEHYAGFGGFLLNPENGEVYAIKELSVFPSRDVGEHVGADMPSFYASGTMSFEASCGKVMWLMAKLAFTKDRRARKSIKRKIRRLERSTK